jgi:hypothetical protein
MEDMGQAGCAGSLNSGAVFLVKREDFLAVCFEAALIAD